MPNYKSDLNQEQILSTYLDSVYSKLNLKFKRIHDLTQQHQGIDLILTHNSNEYRIDEKAQLHYLNKDLPTFTFEISYLKDGLEKAGWLFDTSKKTNFYFLITGIYLKNNYTTLTQPEDVESVKITSVNRKKLLNHLESIELSKEILVQYNNGLRQNEAFGKNTISELNPTTEGSMFFTKGLEEKPINLQLRLKYLIQNGIAKRL